MLCNCCPNKLQHVFQKDCTLLLLHFVSFFLVAHSESQDPQGQVDGGVHQNDFVVSGAGFAAQLMFSATDWRWPRALKSQ